MITVDLPTARRFILGRQGLWPGRRWRAEQGVPQAVRAMEYLQLDPLQVVARSQDISLYSRVLDYSPGLWEQAAYQQRLFFDWGGWLALRPMDELPCWRVVMRREREGYPDCDPRVHKMGREHAAAIEEMRFILRERSLVNNRDFEMSARTRTHSYRGRKDSALALYYLWRTGEVMTHHRENFERVYALAETVAPPELLHERSEAEAERFLFLKEISYHGLARLNRTSDAYFRGLPFSQAGRVCDELLADGKIVEVRVEGWKQVHYAPAGEASLLDELGGGSVPPAWQPLETTTHEEAVFLAPLDPVSARGRAASLFGFDYAWEVYKPEGQRKFGYYTLPVLWGERLVARFDSRLDRVSGTLYILGLWLEDESLGRQADFAQALKSGFQRFGAFLGLSGLNAERIQETLLRQAVGSLKY